RAAANFSVRNGQVLQGRGRGSASSPLYFDSLPGFTVVNVVTSATGMDTRNLDATWGRNGVIVNSTFQGDVDRVSNRMVLVAAIDLNNFEGTARVAGNHIANVPQVGILVSGMPAEESVVLADNDIRQQSIVTDGYGIILAGAHHFEIANNTIVPVNG